MQTTSTAECAPNPRHVLTVRSSDDHIRVDDLELNDLGRRPQHKSVTPDDTAVQTKAQRLRARIQFLALCWAVYLLGWNDGTTGPLLPRIQKVYHVRPRGARRCNNADADARKVNFAVVSLIFVVACIVGAAIVDEARVDDRGQGFLMGAFLNVFLNNRYGFGKVTLFLI